MFHPAQTRADYIARPAHPRIPRQQLKAIPECADIPSSLPTAPPPDGILTNFAKIASRFNGIENLRHGLTCLPNLHLISQPHQQLVNSPALRNPAGIPLINRRPQRRQLRLVLPLFPLQHPQPGPHHLTGILISPAGQLLPHKPVQLFRQIHIPRRHSSTLLRHPMPKAYAHWQSLPTANSPTQTPPRYP